MTSSSLGHHLTRSWLRFLFKTCCNFGGCAARGRDMVPSLEAAAVLLDFGFFSGE